MSLLTICLENQPDQVEVISDNDDIAHRLQEIGVRFEYWTAGNELDADATPAKILAAYCRPVERLKNIYGFQSVDVVSINADHPQKDELRAKFLNEHIHSDFEVRFFVEGRGLFFLHPNDRVYGVFCEQGDLLSVPANTRHWFDMGASPDFKCIRLFTSPDGWEAQFTGDKIAANYPTLDQFLDEYDNAVAD
jgi:1,2-dihydroxy-3-keto-5-methylthiopentene dioxygenase